ncbi:MAG: HAD family hydrolase [Myxococcales bacterium]|nr:HAD family hydrolase [Myxococcales bacterium]
MDSIDLIVLDFDGTFTDVPPSVEPYLAAYGGLLSQWLYAMGTGEHAKEGISGSEWRSTCARLARRSPEVGWALTTTPSAPIAADPYILAGEAAAFVARQRGIAAPVPGDLYTHAYTYAPAEWRPEAADVLRRLMASGKEVAFVSNASSAKIESRLSELLGDAWRGTITVRGGANKFKIDELPHEADAGDASGLTPDIRAAFGNLPAGAPGPGRPIYLRRGSYFATLAKLWKGDPSRIGRTIVCGDIWELDLSMPSALGAQVHLIERAEPFGAYEYERDAADARGSRSPDLHGLLARLGL